MVYVVYRIWEIPVILILAIQCIRHDAYLFEYYKEDFHKRHLNKNSEIDVAFTNAWRQLLLDFWNNQKLIIQPVGFFGMFQRKCVNLRKKQN